MAGWKKSMRDNWEGRRRMGSDLKGGLGQLGVGVGRMEGE